jgi:hypothetical protein
MSYEPRKGDKRAKERVAGATNMTHEREVHFPSLCAPPMASSGGGPSDPPPHPPPASDIAVFASLIARLPKNPKLTQSKFVKKIDIIPSVPIQAGFDCWLSFFMIMGWWVSSWGFGLPPDLWP